MAQALLLLVASSEPPRSVLPSGPVPTDLLNYRLVGPLQTCQRASPCPTPPALVRLLDMESSATPAGTKMRPTRLGAWLVILSKNLVHFDATNPSIGDVENIQFAGRCGDLLIKLSGDRTEKLSERKVKAHARTCGIDAFSLKHYLEVLQAEGCLDKSRDGTTFEVLASSRERVLSTSAKIFTASVGVSKVEQVLPDILEFCLARPKLTSEVRSELAKRLSAEEVEEALALIRTFSLLGFSKLGGRDEGLFYNSYQFGDRHVRIGSALAALPSEKRAQLDDFLGAVAERPGMPLDSIKVPADIKQFAAGLGLTDVSEVVSPVGHAKFVTMPRLAVPSIGENIQRLETDVFHHSKVLLSSLRFGESYSNPGRGRIMSPAVLVDALIRREVVGPCTAIGQDYALLETEGIIKTIPADNKPGQFFMQLRRKEPAQIVRDMIEAQPSGALDARALPTNLELPLGFKGPEVMRAASVSVTAAKDPELMRKFLEEIRT